MAVRWASVLLLWLCAAMRTAAAHDVPLSSVLLDIGRQSVVADLELPLSELSAALQLPLTRNPQSTVSVHGAALRAYVASHFALIDETGHRYALTVGALEIQHSHNANWLSNDWVIVHARLTPPAGASTQRFELRDTAIVERVVSHQSLVYVRRDLRRDLLGDKPVLLGQIGYGATQLTVDTSSGSWLHGFATLYTMGLRHIAEGTDHLLFLLTLLLPAPLLAVGRHWGGAKRAVSGVRTIVSVVSGFTLGHSITLALAATGKISVPASLVEVCIALSILVSSLHAIRPVFAGRELWLASGFGLIHGLAFASTLSGLNFDGATLLVSLVGFNLGIESMQLLVIGAILPLLIALAATRCYAFVRVGGATFAGACAGGWVFERAFHRPNPLQPLVDWLAAPPGWLIGLVCAGSALSLVALLLRPLAQLKTVARATG